MYKVKDLLRSQGLTNSELSVATRALENFSNSQIGQSLGMKEKTVKYHLTNVYKKTQTRNRTEYIVKYLPVHIIDSIKTGEIDVSFKDSI